MRVLTLPSLRQIHERRASPSFRRPPVFAPVQSFHWWTARSSSSGPTVKNKDRNADDCDQQSHDDATSGRTGDGERPENKWKTAAEREEHKESRREETGSAID